LERDLFLYLEAYYDIIKEYIIEDKLETATQQFVILLKAKYHASLPTEAQLNAHKTVWTPDYINIVETFIDKRGVKLAKFAGVLMAIKRLIVEGRDTLAGEDKNKNAKMKSNTYNTAKLLFSFTQAQDKHGKQIEKVDDSKPVTRSENKILLDSFIQYITSDFNRDALITKSTKEKLWICEGTLSLTLGNTTSRRCNFVMTSCVPDYLGGEKWGGNPARRTDQSFGLCPSCQNQFLTFKLQNIDALATSYSGVLETLNERIKSRKANFLNAGKSERDLHLDPAFVQFDTSRKTITTAFNNSNRLKESLTGNLQIVNRVIKNYPSDDSQYLVQPGRNNNNFDDDDNQTDSQKHLDEELKDSDFNNTVEDFDRQNEVEEVDIYNGDNDFEEVVPSSNDKKEKDLPNDKNHTAHPTPIELEEDDEDIPSTQKPHVIIETTPKSKVDNKKANTSTPSSNKQTTKVNGVSDNKTDATSKAAPKSADKLTVPHLVVTPKENTTTQSLNQTPKNLKRPRPEMEGDNDVEFQSTPKRQKTQNTEFAAAITSMITSVMTDDAEFNDATNAIASIPAPQLLLLDALIQQAKMRKTNLSPMKM
jgi:hypothetical protein